MDGDGEMDIEEMEAEARQEVENEERAVKKGLRFVVAVVIVVGAGIMLNALIF
jgi:hypothetical protein